MRSSQSLKNDKNSKQTIDTTSNNSSGHNCNHIMQSSISHVECDCDEPKTENFKKR